MPTKKIADIDQRKGAAGWGLASRPCQHREHNPPSMTVFSPGVWEHSCPGCGRTFVFTVHPSHIVTKDDFVVQPHVRPMGHVVHRPTGDYTGKTTQDDDTNPMHAFGQGRGDASPVCEPRTCPTCGGQAYRHHVC